MAEKASRRNGKAEPSGNWNEGTALELFSKTRPENILEGFEGGPWERAKQAWQRLSSVEDDLRWHRGAVAAAVSDERVYGEGSLRRFAEEMGENYDRLRAYATTYRRVARLPNESRDAVLALPSLSFHHYRVAASLGRDEDYVEALRRASEARMPVNALAGKVGLWRTAGVIESAPELSPAGGAGERYPVLGRIGAPREKQEVMAEKLDAMEIEDREAAMEALARYDRRVTSELADVPYVEVKQNPESPEEIAAKRWDRLFEQIYQAAEGINAAGGASALLTGKPEGSGEAYASRLDRAIEELERLRAELRKGAG